MPRNQWNTGSIGIDEHEARFGRFGDEPDVWDEALTREPTRDAKHESANEPMPAVITDAWLGGL